jgi:protein-tyrosine-phosphatase
MSDDASPAAGAALPRVLFVCVENSNRSQMAEAFARIHGAGVVQAFSAGSKPSGHVNSRAIAALRERGYDLSTHRSKSLADVPQAGYEYVVTMGCGDACPWIAARHREDWDLPDPRDLQPEAFTVVRDDIEQRVIRLLDAVRAGARPGRS